MNISRTEDIIFQHIIELPNCDCVFCSTKELTTGITRLFLIFNDQRRIYARNGLKSTWEEVKDSYLCGCIRKGFKRVIKERKIPCFSAALYL